MGTELSGHEQAKKALGYSVLGLFCLGFVFGPWAISQGLQVRRGKAEGQGMALASIIIGGLATLLGTAILIRIGWNIWTGNYPPGP